MSFSSVFLPLKMTQTVLKKSPWRNVLPRSALPQTFSLEVSRPVHPFCGCAGRLFMRRYRKSRRYLSVDLKKNAKIFKTRVQIKELKTLHKTTREIKTLMRVMRVANRITPMSARPQPKMQSKKRTKTAEPKRARHVHTIGQHHKLRIMAQTRHHNHRQRDSQNDKPGSARSRNQPRDSTQHRVRDPKRTLGTAHRRYGRGRSYGSLNHHARSIRG